MRALPLRREAKAAAEDGGAHRRRTQWSPPEPKYSAESVVHLRIKVNDMPARSQAKAAGGRWAPEKQLWRVKCGKIAGTSLEKHIYVDASGK